MIILIMIWFDYDSRLYLMIWFDSDHLIKSNQIKSFDTLDYSISVQETYLKVVDYWFYVKEGNDLTLLNYVQDRNDANNLPS